MLSPPFGVLTTHFDDSDREAARSLGGELYERLTRSTDEPLAHGPRVPVRCAVAERLVQPGDAEELLVLPVLGPEAGAHLDARYVLGRLAAWREAGATVVPVAGGEGWSREDELRDHDPIDAGTGVGDPAVLRLVLDRIGRVLRPEPGLRLRVSHAPDDPSAVEIAERIRCFLDLEGDPWVSGGDDDWEADVLVVLRGGGYESSARCRRDVYRIMQLGNPSVTVDLRTLLSGNAGGADGVALQAMAELVRALSFRRQARAMVASAGLPGDTTVIVRQPDLVDIYRGPLRAGAAQVVVHPDPELGTVDRELLRHANPRLRTITPSTLHRFVLASEGDRRSLPIDGERVAFSIADSPDAGGPEGLTDDHLRDAVVELARVLVSSGANLAYGGDFREEGYTWLFAGLIETYNDRAAVGTDRLHVYQPADSRLDAAPDDLDVTLRSLARGGEVGLAGEAVVRPDSDFAHTDALALSDMRRLMTRHTDARVVVGGKTSPEYVTENGFTGRFPGILEEAWRSLTADRPHPLYVLGGLGGAARVVAELMRGRGDLDEWKDERWRSRSPELAAAWQAIDEHPLQRALGLPGRLQELAAQIAEIGEELLDSDDRSVAWNGLTRRENLRLFDARDPVEIGALVTRGLTALSRSEVEGMYPIELVRGGLEDVEQVDAVAFAAFDGVPVTELGPGIEGGLAEARARDGGRTFTCLRADQAPADYLLCASLGALGSESVHDEEIESVARHVAEVATRHGFGRIAVASFGGRLLGDAELVASAMLRGFRKGGLSDRTSLVWIEGDCARFDRLRQLFDESGDVALTVRQPRPETDDDPADASTLGLFVTRSEGRLNALVTLPGPGTGVVSTCAAELTDAELEELAAGDGRDTPSHDLLSERAPMLARLLLGEKYESLLRRSAESGINVVHDRDLSNLPFELLVEPTLIGEGSREELAHIHRQLAVPNLAPERLVPAPPPRVARVLLVFDPTDDLPAARKEGGVLRKRLEKMSSSFELLAVLTSEQATVDEVLEKLQHADIFHYAGHGFFEGAGPASSGLRLHDGKLTLAQLVDRNLRPQLAFVNACEAGRVRGGGEAAHPEAFAEYFLLQGVQAFLGTYWNVDDHGAAIFAKIVYTQLAEGRTVAEAVCEARRVLRCRDEPLADWANYRLYGDGRFRIARQRP